MRLAPRCWSLALCLPAWAFAGAVPDAEVLALDLASCAQGSSGGGACGARDGVGLLQHRSRASQAAAANATQEKSAGRAVLERTSGAVRMVAETRLGRGSVRARRGDGYNDCRRRKQPKKSDLPKWNQDMKRYFDDYRQYEDIVSYIDKLQARYPDVITLVTIGQSWEGRPLRVMELTLPVPGVPAADKPMLFLEGGIHAREWIAPTTVLYIATRMAKKASSDAEVEALLKKYVVAFFAPVNPDGYVYSWEKSRMWRKTRSNRKDYACHWLDDEVAGVDANRNWGYSWDISDDANYKAQLHNPCTEVFNGPYAFSEPETHSPSNYMTARQTRSHDLRTADDKGKLVPGPGYVAAYVDFHSYGQVLLPPWAWSANYPSNPDGKYQTDLTSKMTAAVKSKSGRSFRAGPDVFPADPGTGPDWALGALGIRASMTIELEPTSSYVGFCLPKSYIKSVGREQFANIMSLGKFLMDNGDVPSTNFGPFASKPWAASKPSETSPAASAAPR